MTQSLPSEEMLKQAIKEALAETLQEQRGLFHDIFAEVLEDVALGNPSGRGNKQISSIDQNYECVPLKA